MQHDGKGIALDTLSKPHSCMPGTNVDYVSETRSAQAYSRQSDFIQK